jgi:hypothetical protein
VVKLIKLRYSIPLVLEQNHFEFEPGLKQIKTKSKKADEIKGDRSDKYKGQKISLYDGTILGKNGEIDHIIPRSSRYGILTLLPSSKSSLISFHFVIAT